MHPELIPGASPGARPCREFQSEVGPADIVVVDVMTEGTLVECKLASNPQIRREIVGQMFDYASRLWKMDVDDFAVKLRARTTKPVPPARPDRLLSSLRKDPAGCRTVRTFQKQDTAVPSTSE